MLYSERLKLSGAKQCHMLFRTLYSISDEAPRSPTHSAAALLFLSSFDKPSIHHVQLPFLPAVTSPMGTYLTVVGPLLNLTCSDGDTSHWNKQTGSSNLNAAVYSNTSGCMASYSFTGKQVGALLSFSLRFLPSPANSGTSILQRQSRSVL